MKNIFFIGKRQLENYPYFAIQNKQNYRFIALMSEKDSDEFPNTIKKYFEKIYAIKANDRFLSELDYNQTLNCIKNELRQHPSADLPSIICQDEANVMLAGKIRTALDIPWGPRDDQLLCFRDKDIMKKMINDHGIRSPKYKILTEKLTYGEIVSFLDLPFIAKPIDSAGSFGVYKINNQQEWVNVREIIFSSHEIYEVEEFIVGNFYHCDLVVGDHEILFAEVCRYSCGNLDFQSGLNIGSIILLRDDKLREAIILFAQQALQALGMPEGAHHMEIFQKDNGELVFLEVGARAPGFSCKIYEKSIGKSPLDIDLTMQAGVKFSKRSHKLEPSFNITFPMGEGRIKKLISPQIKSIYEITWNVKVGDLTKKSSSNANVGGSLLAYNSDFAVLKNDFDKLSKFIFIDY